MTTRRRKPNPKETPGSRGKNGGRAGKTRPVSRKELNEELPEAKAEAAEAAGGEENLPDPGEPPENVDFLAVDRLWREVATIKKAFEDARARLKDREADLEAAQQDLADAQAAINTEKQDWAEERADATRLADEEARKLDRRRAEADEREERLTKLELALAEQQEAAKSNASTAVREALASARQEIDSDRAELAKQRKACRDELVKLQSREEDLNDERELFEERVRREVERTGEQLRLRLQALESRHQTLLSDHTRLEEKLAEYQRIEREFPDFDPDRVLADLRRLEDDNSALRAERPSAETIAEMERLRKAELRWDEDRTFLHAENARLQQKLSAFTVNAFELHRLEVVKEALEADKEAYESAVKRLRDDFDGLKQRKEGISPFPECYRMDEKHKYARDDLVNEIPPLPEFVDQLRHFIAQQDGLFYSQTDLRLFLAGLAATRLHLLQGPSGTGKTQLPLAFAKAINASAVVVPVGADWRTPQDLAGYYNTFERRFYESKFTQAVYQASCPQFATQPFFVVLDEMNLSHPEQYFSDVLSALEVKAKNSDATMLIELMTTQVDPAPRQLLDGRLLPLPPNLWFVGTANQDETTVGFAEKTFDRSNVLELPVRPERFEPKSTEPLPPFALRALLQRFDDAKADRKHQDACRTVENFIGGKLKDRVWKDFRIDVGPRALEHLKSFVPAMCAAGGSVREAADHVVAMKVLRKIRGHYQFPSTAIDALRDDLPKIWEALPGTGEPVRSIELLEDELHRRGGA
jgi:hypothetical protein